MKKNVKYITGSTGDARVEVEMNDTNFTLTVQRLRISKVLWIFTSKEWVRSKRIDIQLANCDNPLHNGDNPCHVFTVIMGLGYSGEMEVWGRQHFNLQKRCDRLLEDFHLMERERIKINNQAEKQFKQL